MVGWLFLQEERVYEQSVIKQDACQREAVVPAAAYVLGIYKHSLDLPVLLAILARR